MTSRKGTIPAGKKISRDQNDHYESIVLAEIEKTPTARWGNMLALWLMLPQLYPATRKRILAQLIRLACKRGEVLSPLLMQRLGPHLVRELNTKPSRSRIHDPIAFRTAAIYKAHHPKASLREIEKAAMSTMRGEAERRRRDPGTTTILRWQKHPEFKQIVNDERALIAVSRQQWRDARKRKPGDDKPSHGLRVWPRLTAREKQLIFG